MMSVEQVTARSTSQVTIGCDLLKGSGKKGILKPDFAGYYDLVLGAYGVNNSQGMFYDMASGVSMFREDSPLMRRCKKGVLYMEFKHPEPFLANGNPMSESQYFARLRKIDDDRQCGHIRELTLLDGTDENNRPCKFVIGKVKPHGPFGKYLQESLDNPHVNTYCSVRSITNDNILTGVKYTSEIITWDMVGEGGILGANKYNSPALEAFSAVAVVITPKDIWAVDDQYEEQKRLGLESATSLDVKDLMQSLGWERVKRPKPPAYLR